jgi:hypothetical protein
VNVEPTVASAELLEMINTALAVVVGLAVTVALVVLAATGAVSVWSACLCWLVGLPLSARLLFALSALMAVPVLDFAYSAER